MTSLFEKPTPDKLKENAVQLSTDLPYGADAIAAHLASGEKLKPNVRREADRAFIRELERTDPKRFHRLAISLTRSSSFTAIDSKEVADTASQYEAITEAA